MANAAMNSRVLSDRICGPLSLMASSSGRSPAAVGPAAIELQGELTGVADLFQVRPLTLDVPEKGFDPGLIGGLSGQSEISPPGGPDNPC